jgi:LEA14-like dessication related protein
MKNTYLYIALGALAFFIFGKKYSAGVLDQLTYSFSIGNIDLANFKIGINLKIFNPTPFSVTIDGIFGSVNTAGQSVFDFFENQSKTIRPGNNELSIFATPQPGTIITNFRNLLEQPLEVKYTITSGPLAIKQTIPLI